MKVTSSTIFNWSEYVKKKKPIPKTKHIDHVYRRGISVFVWQLYYSRRRNERELWKQLEQKKERKKKGETKIVWHLSEKYSPKGHFSSIRHNVNIFLAVVWLAVVLTVPEGRIVAINCVMFWITLHVKVARFSRADGKKGMVWVTQGLPFRTNTRWKWQIR